MKRFVVVGSPVSHSLSPEMHNALFAHLGVDWTFERQEVSAGGFAAFVDSHDYDGYTVTMPLKEEAFVHTREHDAFASESGAVNTVTTVDGRAFGANTDVPGFRSALEEAGVTSVDKAIVIGSGATARSAISAIRPISRNIAVLARNEAVAHSLSHVDEVLAWSAKTPFHGCDLVVSTLPPQVDLDFEGDSGLLFDVVYRPWPTPLASRWHGTVLSGLELLIHQAAFQARIFAQPLALDLVEVRSIMRRAAMGEPPLPR